MEIKTQDSRPFYSPELLQARRVAAVRRCAAMCADRDTVAGIQLSPLTPSTYSRLVTIDSPFIYKQGPVTRSDVRNYIWIHSPMFTTAEPLATTRKEQVVAAVELNLAPHWRRWKYSRHAWQTMVAAGYAQAAADIRELTQIAFADAPPGTGSTKVISASLEAQLIDLFARDYRHWPFDTRIQDTPLRKLYQLVRCAGGPEYDADEAAIVAAELARENAELAARRN